MSFTGDRCSVAKIRNERRFSRVAFPAEFGAHGRFRNIVRFLFFWVFFFFSHFDHPRKESYKTHTSCRPESVTNPTRRPSTTAFRLTRRRRAPHCCTILFPIIERFLVTGTGTKRRRFYRHLVFGRAIFRRVTIIFRSPSARSLTRSDVFLHGRLSRFEL